MSCPPIFRSRATTAPRVLYHGPWPMRSRAFTAARPSAGRAVTLSCRPAGTLPCIPQAAPAKRAVLVVPDVRNEVYVFAKSTLEEAGFAWKVTGGVPGYPANRVAAQAPAAGMYARSGGRRRIAPDIAGGWA